MSDPRHHDPPATTLEQQLGGRADGLDQRVRILESALESMGDGVAVVDEHGKFLLFNSAARRIYGRDLLDGSVESWPDTYGIFRPDGVTHFPPHELPLARALRGESSDQVELLFRNAAHPEGIFVASTGRPLRDADNRVHGGIVVLRDISLHKRAEIELRDTNQRLSQLVADQARRAEQSRILAEMSSLLQATSTVDELYAVIADYFERLFPRGPGAFFVYSASRDDLEQKACWGGYAAGDAVLREFSALLAEGIRGADIASRYGGEEFTILLPDTAATDAGRKAAQLLERARGLRLTFNGHDVGAISASVGVAAYPGHGEQAEDLLRAADAALYAAKQAGRDRVEIAPHGGQAV